MSWSRYHIRGHPAPQTALEVNDLPPSPTRWILMMLKEKCSMIDSELDKNQKTQMKALAICSGDDTHDPFTKIFFMQAESKTTVAKKCNNLHLSMTVFKVKLKFVYETNNIDNMINKLMKQKEKCIKCKNGYVDEFTNGMPQMEKKQRLERLRPTPRT
eukprot:15028960-Heterocapsa_arctica.AAC.1